MKNTLLFIYSINILVRLLTVNMKNCLTPKNLEMCDPILVTLLKIRPHYSQSSRENATPSSSSSPLASYKEVPPGISFYLSRFSPFQNFHVPPFPLLPPVPPPIPPSPLFSQSFTPCHPSLINEFLSAPRRGTWGRTFPKITIQMFYGREAY